MKGSNRLGTGRQKRTILAAALLLSLVSTVAATSGAGAASCRKARSCSSDASPSISILDPRAGAIISGVTVVDGTASDDVGIVKVEVRVDRRAFVPATGITPWTFVLDSTTYAAGQHTLSARATDTAGNTSTSSVTVDFQNTTAVDTTPPTVSIAAPAFGATVAGTVQVSGSSGDDIGVTAVTVRVDAGTALVATGTASWSVAVDTPPYADGSHVITATAFDAAGNTAVATTTVTSLNAPPPSPSPSPSPSPGPSPSTGPSPSPSPSSTPSPTQLQVNIAAECAGTWNADQIKALLQANARNLAAVGPTLTIFVQGGYSSEAATGVSSSGGAYYGFQAYLYLGCDPNSTFTAYPDNVMAHEYGHAWTQYWLYTSHNGSWHDYLVARGLDGDPRLNTSYVWDTDEIAADDYRMLLGSSLALAQGSRHLNPYIADPRDVNGLRNFLTNSWAA
jgi:hypothetical protein